MPDAAAPIVSVVVPTLNEADNLPLLVPRIAAGLAGRPYEVIVVDDNSADATPQVCATLAREYPLHLLIRPHPKDGLSGAVLEGLKLARGQYFVVLDADLQHPPEKIDELLKLLERGDADFVIGSRYVPGAATDERWTLFRQLNSRIATVLARPFAGRTHDPMSGFFALPRALYDRAERLTPLGYKIALELMCKTRAKSVREVPIHFATRIKGQSKLTLTQQFKYLEHLSRLYDYTFPRAAPAIKFLIATGVAWLAALALYVTFLQLHWTIRQSLVLCYPAAILATAVFHLRYVRTQREFLPRPHPWRDFWLVALAEWVTVIAFASWLSHIKPTAIYPLEALSVGLCAATAARYVLRKEFLMDIRGLRPHPRQSEVS